MSFISDIIEGPYTKVIELVAITALVMALLGFTWYKGDEHGTKKYTDYVAAQAVETTRVVLKRADVIEKVVIKYRDKAAATQAVTETVKKDVDEYAKLHMSYDLDPEWRRLHDEAATQTIIPAVPAGAVPAGGEAPTAAEALDTVTKNYGAAKRNANRLDALIEAWNRAAGVK